MNRVIKLTAAAIVLVVLSCTGFSKDQLYFVFLNKGINKTPLSKDQAQKLQAEHIGNLMRLGKLGKALFAGPLGDDGYIRGTVVVRASSPSEVRSLFKPDPFIQRDYLSAEIHPWAASPTAFKKPGEVMKLEQFALVIVKRTSPSANFSDISLIEEWMKSGELAVAGSVTGSSDVAGIMLFRIGDLNKVRLLISKDPLFSRGSLVADVRPQFSDAAVLAKD